MVLCVWRIPKLYLSLLEFSQFITIYTTMKRVKFGFLAAAALFSVAILASCQNNTSDKSAEIAKLEKIVAETNKQCPYYLIEEMTLECFELKNNNLVFCYVVSDDLWVEFEPMKSILGNMDKELREAIIAEILPDFIAYAQIDDGFVEMLRMCVAADYGIATKYRPAWGDGFTMQLAAPRELREILETLDK